MTQGKFRLRPPPLPLLQPLPLLLPRLVIPKMAPLDLDKYVEIARLCKYLPENDLKVSPAGAGALFEGSPLPAVGRPPARPSFLRDPRWVSRPVAVEGLPQCQATRSDPASRRGSG